MTSDVASDNGNSVFYRMSVAKDKPFESIPCTSPNGISVLDVKRVVSDKFSKSSDFDIEVKDQATSRVMTDEGEVVPPGTHLLLKRTPGKLMARLAAAAAIQSTQATNKLLPTTTSRLLPLINISTS